jgi:hypothetical protein
MVCARAFDAQATIALFMGFGRAVSRMIYTVLFLCRNIFVIASVNIEYVALEREVKKHGIRGLYS